MTEFTFHVATLTTLKVARCSPAENHGRAADRHRPYHGRPCESNSTECSGLVHRFDNTRFDISACELGVSGQSVWRKTYSAPANFFPKTFLHRAEPFRPGACDDRHCARRTTRLPSDASRHAREPFLGLAERRWTMCIRTLSAAAVTALSLSIVAGGSTPTVAGAAAATPWATAGFAARLDSPRGLAFD